MSTFDDNIAMINRLKGIGSYSPIPNKDVYAYNRIREAADQREEEELKRKIRMKKLQDEWDNLNSKDFELSLAPYQPNSGFDEKTGENVTQITQPLNMLASIAMNSSMPTGTQQSLSDAVSAAGRGITASNQGKDADEIQKAVSDVLSPYEPTYEFRTTTKDVYNKNVANEVKALLEDKKYNKAEMQEVHKDNRNTQTNATRTNIAKMNNDTQTSIKKLDIDYKKLKTDKDYCYKLLKTGLLKIKDGKLVQGSGPVRMNYLQPGEHKNYLEFKKDFIRCRDEVLAQNNELTPEQAWAKAEEAMKLQAKYVNPQRFNDYVDCTKAEEFQEEQIQNVLESPQLDLDDTLKHMLEGLPEDNTTQLFDEEAFLKETANG